MTSSTSDTAASNSRITQTYSLDLRPPALGRIVFYHPKRIDETSAASLPAVIHHISDLQKGIVDLTVFCDKGPLVKRDVEQAGGAVAERWSDYQSA